MKIISKHDKVENDMLVCSNINQSFGEKIVAFLNLSCRDEKSSYRFELVPDSHESFTNVSYMDFTTNVLKKLMEILVVDNAKLNLAMKNLENKMDKLNVAANINFDFLNCAEFYKLMQSYRWTPSCSLIAPNFKIIIEYIKLEILKQVEK